MAAGPAPKGARKPARSIGRRVPFGSHEEPRHSLTEDAACRMDRRRPSPRRMLPGRNGFGFHPGLHRKSALEKVENWRFGAITSVFYSS